MNCETLKREIERIWDDRALLSDDRAREAVCEVIELLDRGLVRVAEPEMSEAAGAEGADSPEAEARPGAGSEAESWSESGAAGRWRVNEWVKKAVLLYFPLRGMSVTHAGPLEFHDKMELKHGYDKLGVRVVPHAVARYGAYLAPGVVMMPSYVNIGAYVDEGTMVDTWATVGSCAQIGKRVHLSGGVGIGGVLEPVQAAPVIIEDDCFLGSRCIVVEGARVCRGAVLGANVVITGSTRIIDVSGPQPVEYRGLVPPGSVVIPGALPKSFPAGEYSVPCALIIGKRKESTDKKTSLNQALRDFDVPL